MRVKISVELWNEDIMYKNTSCDQCGKTPKQYVEIRDTPLCLDCFKRETKAILDVLRQITGESPSPDLKIHKYADIYPYHKSQRAGVYVLSDGRVLVISPDGKENAVYSEKEVPKSIQNVFRDYEEDRYIRDSRLMRKKYKRLAEYMEEHSDD